MALCDDLKGARGFKWCRQFVDDFGGFSNALAAITHQDRSTVLMALARQVMALENPESPREQPRAERPSEPPPASMIRPVMPAVEVVEPEPSETDMLSLDDIEYLLGGL